MSVEAASGLANRQTNIFPNPAYGPLSISSGSKITEVSILNLLGQAVYSNNYNAYEVNIDVSALSPGAYFVKVNGTEAVKFVKQ